MPASIARQDLFGIVTNEIYDLLFKKHEPTAG